MGQKHSAKYSLTKKSANQRQSAQVGDEVAFSTDAPDRAPDEPVGVNISSQSNDYIGNAAQTMAKVWTERAVAESTEKDEPKETGAGEEDGSAPDQDGEELAQEDAEREEMKPEERGEAEEQSFAPVPSNNGPEEADQQQRQAQAENEKNQEEEGEGEDSAGTESEAQITLDEEKEAAEQIGNKADEAEAENVAQEVGEVEAEVGQQDEEKQEQSSQNVANNVESVVQEECENAAADPVPPEVVSVPSEEEGPVKGVEPDECKENVPLENGTPMDPSSFYQISSIAVETDESANGTVPGQCQQLNGEMVCCVGTDKSSEL